MRESARFGGMGFRWPWRGRHPLKAGLFLFSGLPVVPSIPTITEDGGVEEDIVASNSLLLASMIGGERVSPDRATRFVPRTP